MKNIDKKSRGRTAEKPKDIPVRGWKEVLWRVKDSFTNDYLDVVSAGVGFYFFLALFPLIAAVLAIYGLVFAPAEVQQHVDQLTAVLPDQAHALVADGMQRLARQSGQGLGWALVISILISLWSANKGTKALFDGINIAYNERIERGFIKNNIISLIITLGGIVVGLICAIFVVAFPAFIGNMGLPDTLADVIALVRWPILFLIVMFSISILFKFAPDRDNPQFRWVNWGAGVATSLWIIGSLLFSLYVDNFGDFDATYGSVAAVIILMLWFQLTAICVLLGAEINAELEYQTAKDTTVGKPQPMGQRHAYHADHVVGDGSEGKNVIGKSDEGKELDTGKTKKDREGVRREIKVKKAPKGQKPEEIKDKGRSNE